MYAILTAVETGINQITNVDFGADYKKQANTAWGQGKYLQSVLYSVDGLIESAIDVVLAPTAIVTSTVDNFFQKTLGLDLDEMAMTLQANGLLQAAGETLYYATQWAKTTAVVTGNSKIISKVTKTSKRADFYVKPNGETLPGTMYRYSDSSTFSQLSKTKSAKTSYVTPQKFTTREAAIDGLQIDIKNWSNDCRIISAFDSLQVIDDIRIPYSHGGRGPNLEPITKSYPDLGAGGYPQYTANTIINFDTVEILP